MPEGIQLRRVKGWRKPEGAVVVTRPGNWGNPFRTGDLHPDHGWPMSASEAVECYRKSLETFSRNQLPPEEYCNAWRRYRSLALGLWVVVHAKRELSGKDLCCFCPLDKPCHRNVLLEFANGA